MVMETGIVLLIRRMKMTHLRVREQSHHYRLVIAGAILVSERIPIKNPFLLNTYAASVRSNRRFKN